MSSPPRVSRSFWRSWPIVALGTGIGLIVGSIIDATAQDIVDPGAPPRPAVVARSPLVSLPTAGAATGEAGPTAPRAAEAAPLLEALSVRSDALNEQIASINAGETALALQLREIEARLVELREVQQSIEAGCAATQAEAIAEAAAAAVEAERLALAALAPPPAPEPAPAPEPEAPVAEPAEAPAEPAPPEPDPAVVAAERERGERLAVLTETVRAMRGENAASLLQALDIDLAAAILRRMSPRDSGRLLDRIGPDRAAELSEALLEPEEEL